MWSDLLIVSIIGGVVAADTTAAWQVMICRPIVSGPLIGLAMGDLQTGLLFGAMMELVWAGVVPVGASVFPDSNVGTVVATAVAIWLQDYQFSLHFAVLAAFLYMIPVTFIGERSIVLMRKMNATLMRRALRFAQEGQARNVALQNWMGVGYAFGRGFLYSGLMFVIGSDLLVRGCSLYDGLDNGRFSLAVLPVLALGGAVLLAIFVKKRTIGFLAVGVAIGIALSFL